jgi:4-amino-4-deoxy-L-arabinose transferase-like glycosyltransferase
MTKLAQIPSKVLTLKGLLWTGAVIHLVATILVYLIGRLELLPILIDSNGVLQGDATLYLEKCQLISQKISNWNFSFLIGKEEQIHIRLFAPFFKIFSSIFGENVLAFEFVNIFIFLGILFLIYKIGEISFDTKTGLISALVVIFIPSFLLHTTQPLRDQFYILLFLTIVCLFLKILDQKLRAKELLFYLLGLIPLFLMIWLIRDGAILLYLSILLIALVLLLIKNLKSLRSVGFNLLLILILLGFVGTAPYLFERIVPAKAITSFEKYNTERNYTLQQKAEKDALTARINVIRFRFNNTYSGGSASDIDGNVFFDDWTQVLSYLPRALAIGFLAPFPNMWFTEGKFVGSSGRLVAGLETLFIYLVYALAIVTIYYYSRSIKTWFLVSICLVGALSLGLVVVNIGALYRTRYVLWLLVIILGTKGFISLWGKRYSIESPKGAEN